MQGPRSSETARQSVRNLLCLLTNVVAGQRSEFEVDGLSSQAKLAGTCLPTHAISSMSLNTCKRAADDCLPGGFAQLDNARKAALRTLQESVGIGPDDSPRTKAGLARKLASQKVQIEVLEEDLAQLTGAFDFAVRCARKYARLSNKPELMHQLALDLEEIRARASLVKSRLYLAHSGAEKTNEA